MSDIIERTFKCTGCGEARPCILTTTQAKAEIEFFDPAEYLECVLDETNKTSHNWKEVQANGADKSTEPALYKHIVSNRRELFDKFYDWLDGLTQEEYDDMSLTDKCEKFFFKT